MITLACPFELQLETAMKYVLFVTIGISTLWELSFATDNSLLATYKTGFGSVMWGTALIYLYDFWMAMTGKNSPYMIEFYSQLKKDLMVCVISGITLFALFASLPSKYSFSNIDVAFLGVPFLFYSIFEILKSGSLKVAGSKMPRRVIWGLLGIIGLTYILCFYLLREILTNKFLPMQALWFQITIFFTSFCAFIGSSQIRFMLEEQRIEVSPVMLGLFSTIGFSQGLYRDVAEGASQWNAHVKGKKAEQRKIAQRKRRKRR